MLRAIAAFWAIAACVGCSGVSATSDEPAAFRDRLDRELCAAKTLDDVTNALRREKIEYYLNRERRILTAKRSFYQEKLVSSSVVIEIQFEGSDVRHCKVQIMHTGP